MHSSRGSSDSTNRAEEDEMARERIDLGDLVGRRTDRVFEELEKQGVKTSRAVEELTGPLALHYAMRPAPTASPGDHVRVITTGNRVVGFEVDPAEGLAELRDRVGDLDE